MILKALYDYYNRCDLPTYGIEAKEIGFLLVLSREGRFLRFESLVNKNRGKEFYVKKHQNRTSGTAPNYLYDSSDYVFGISDKNKSEEKNIEHFEAFKNLVSEIAAEFDDSADLKALTAFYSQSREEILEQLKADPLWETVEKSLSKKYSAFSFRIEGDVKIVAEKRELLRLETATQHENGTSRCLVTGERCEPVTITTATMIPGSQATAKLVAFQVGSGYDSYGKSQGQNAPISPAAEFAYTTALNYLLRKDSRNKFLLGTTTFVFWSSGNSEAGQEAEDSLFDLLFGPIDDDPDDKVEQARKVFKSIYSGSLTTELDDKFFILGLKPNSARIAVCYWSETPLREFAGKILQHFEDMELIDTRREKKPYRGLNNMLRAVTLGGKLSDVSPNLPEAVAKSIFQGYPYPQTLISACIRRIRAEQDARRIDRISILKACLNRSNGDDNNDKKLNIMLDKENTNHGYVCGRLFAVLDKIQDEANGIRTIRERYMNAASATPASVFATILNLSTHHSEKLSEGRKIYFEKLKQEIIDKLSSNGFPSHLDLQDQGRFFVGYYHQMQDFFTKKENNQE